MGGLFVCAGRVRYLVGGNHPGGSRRVTEGAYVEKSRAVSLQRAPVVTAWSPLVTKVKPKKPWPENEARPSSGTSLGRRPVDRLPTKQCFVFPVA